MPQQHIMVVDGSTVSRELITRRLAEVMDEAQITACASAAEAQALLQDERYDLITTALMLPDMDGLDLCRQIRDSKANHYTPVILISGDADSRLLREGFAAGVTDYFNKSLGFKAFGNFIKDFSERHAGLVGRVLFVEDSRTSAALTMRILDHHGLQVIHTTSAEAALELLSEARDKPGQNFDIVITDFHLQGEMTGGDLLHVLRVRHHYSQQELPVLVITGNDDNNTQVEVFHAGANDFVNKPLVEEILMARVRALLLIKHQYDALKRQAADMERMATTDGLTGVRNRRFLLEEGPALLENPATHPLWVMVIDIDHFKRINDNHGHLTGDQVLMALGRLLNESFPDGMAVRFGGEEFIVLLPCATGNSAAVRAEGLRQTVAGLRPGQVDVTISIGLASAADHPRANLNTLVGLADQALYKAKETGRNRIFINGAGEEIAPPLVGNAAG